MKNQKGITLIALVITIIVMLILVGVSVTVALNGGLFTTAKEAAEGTVTKRNEELNLSNGKVEINGEWYNSIDEYVNFSGNAAELEPISVETDCVKYYANLDEDEEPEGVIYIDKANTKSGSWNGSYSYTITNVRTGLKEYYVSKEAYEGKFGTADVLSLVPGSTGEERFYVMALEDAKTDVNTRFYWYYNAPDYNSYDGISEYSTLTATGVGKGKTNTANMINAWGSYGNKNDRDVWGALEDGWYIPSKEEFSAFASAFSVTSSNYNSTYGLSGGYWSSTLLDSINAWRVAFSGDYGSGSYLANGSWLRLGTTF